MTETPKKCRYCEHAEWTHCTICNLKGWEVNADDHCEKFQPVKGTCGNCDYFSLFGRHPCILLESMDCSANSPACMFFDRYLAAMAEEDD